jgi:hypothetical protein
MSHFPKSIALSLIPQLRANTTTPKKVQKFMLNVLIFVDI